MSDPLSIAASIAGLIVISAQIVGIAKDLIDKVQDTPETMMQVREEVEGEHANDVLSGAAPPHWHWLGTEP